MAFTPGPWKLEDGAILVPLEGGWAQIATMSPTRWMFPDGGNEGDFKRLRKAYEEAIGRK